MIIDLSRPVTQPLRSSRGGSATHILLVFIACAPFLALLLPGQAAARGPESVTLVESATPGGKLILADFFPGAMPPEDTLAALPDLESQKILPEEVGRSYHYFRANFDHIHALGIDGIIYVSDGHPLPGVLPAALKDAGLRATVLIDLPALPIAPPRVNPSEIRRYVEAIAAPIISFFHSLPSECRALDSADRLPLFLMGFPREVDGLPSTAQDVFFAELIDRIEAPLDQKVRLYWGSPTSPAVLRATQSFGEIRTINSTLHSPHYPMTDALSVNVFFDERYPATPAPRGNPPPRVDYSLHRVQQALWIAQQRQCRIIRFAGWNAFADGTNLAPDRAWRNRKSEIVASFIQTVRARQLSDVPDTLVIVPPEDEAGMPDPDVLAELYPIVPFADVVSSTTTVFSRARYENVINTNLQGYTLPPAAAPSSSCNEIFQPLDMPCLDGAQPVPSSELVLPFTMIHSATDFANLPADAGVAVMTNPLLETWEINPPKRGRTYRIWSRSGLYTGERPDHPVRFPPGAVAESWPD